ncbi:MAG: hypothetical protein EXX96DRAFT_480636 [Benjaminiella poitrasii]|nr:MAG: hypothetical protein EXX96DRAFT_480636 [Benjaminiella poitrasii]
MTAGDLHFGLYRQPPIWRMSEMTLDTLIFMDTEALNKQETTQSSNTDEHSKNARYNKLIRNNEKEDDSCLCCVIS